MLPASIGTSMLVAAQKNLKDEKRVTRRSIRTPVSGVPELKSTSTRCRVDVSNVVRDNIYEETKKDVVDEGTESHSKDAMITVDGRSLPRHQDAPDVRARVFEEPTIAVLAIPGSWI